MMTVNDEFEKIRTGTVVAYFKGPYQNLTGGTVETHRKLQSGYPVSGSRFEAGIFRIRSRNENDSSVTYGVVCIDER